MTEMTALRAHHRGGPEVLIVEPAPVPVPAALRDHAKVQPGEDVLVLGGGGGVGALTVHLASILGANVTATVRSDTGDFVRDLGAKRVVDVPREAFDDAGPAYDVVIDTVGGETLDRSYAVLRPGGRLVTLSAPLLKERPTNTASRQHFSSWRQIETSSLSWLRLSTGPATR